MLNKIVIMGRLVADPELKSTSNGTHFCSFRIACDRDRQTEGGQKADFVNCVAWRSTADFVSKWFTKGKPILICGRLQVRQWQDKEGKNNYSTEILCESCEFCGGPKAEQNGQAMQAAPDVGAVPEFKELDLGGEELPWEDHDM